MSYRRQNKRVPGDDAGAQSEGPRSADRRAFLKGGLVIAGAAAGTSVAARAAEEEARLRRWGLWQDKQPMPPWEWRKRRK